ncbi:hypothetical protein CFBP7900_17670 [Xanthomonas hortorum pv. carotae]|uniref:Uncharacterized protein n=1 Tax=Xanthomonas hortorum pv. carotae TaxID=487904 RepID=A0A6V7D702_9XANT|nr:hypothetical protein CFBP7900_17670 [Xanthomonas hortorum pv. carotae]CAD0328154.1 hypothetical protein CFBP7900_17670 [Xanthomonas hortorum pv. carotae]
MASRNPPAGRMPPPAFVELVERYRQHLEPPAAWGRLSRRAPCKTARIAAQLCALLPLHSNNRDHRL